MDFANYWVNHSIAQTKGSTVGKCLIYWKSHFPVKIRQTNCVIQWIEFNTPEKLTRDTGSIRKAHKLKYNKMTVSLVVWNTCNWIVLAYFYTVGGRQVVGGSVL